MIHRAIPELVKGIRVQYQDKDMKTRVETIYSRSGNSITVINGLKLKTRVNLDSVTGYWQPRVKASPKYMVQLNVRKNLV